MPIVLETGGGVRAANSYVLPAFVTSYLTDRNRQTEATWSTRTTAEQEAACVAATDYIDSRWGRRFKSTKAVSFAGLDAVAELDYTGNPAGADSFSLGDQVYTYVVSLNVLNTGEILIGATTDATVQNTIDAINGNTTNVGFSRALSANRSAQAALVAGSTVNILLTALQEGLPGNDITLTESSSVITLTSVFVNGLDGGSQSLEFPRAALFDQDGIRVLGVPLRLREAAAEYAVRAVAAALWKDPTVDDTGRAVVEKFEKVGPLEERTKYEEGSALSQLIRPYPAADRLLQDYVVPTGRVTR